MCGELFAVLKMKLDEAPGMKTALSPETLGRILKGLNRCWSSICGSISPDVFLGSTLFDSLKNCRR
jgi:hypothetical protein